MPSSLKIKKKPITLGKATSDTSLPKSITSTQKLIQSSRVDIDLSDHSKDLVQTIRSPHKGNHYLNLQIPSLNTKFSANSVKSMIKSKIITPKSLKSSQVNSLKKKKIDLDLVKSPTEDYNLNKNERLLDDINEEARFLEKELQKAVDENKRLKNKMHPGKVPENYIEDLMKNFKNRLQKILYDG